MSEEQVQDVYEYRPLPEQIPEDWRYRIDEINQRYKQLYTALIYDVMAEV